MRLAALALALAACWTDTAAPPRVVASSQFVVPPPTAASTAGSASTDELPLGNASRGCDLMLDKGCARCHFRGVDPRWLERRKQLGITGIRRAMTRHPDPSLVLGDPPNAEEREDLATCLATVWF